MGILDELHRHRAHHVQQINAVNMAATVGLAGLALTIILANKVGGGTGRDVLAALSWTAFGIFCLGGVVLFAAAGMHWDFHSRRIRFIDGLMGSILEDSTREDEVRKRFVHSIIPKDRDAPYSGIADKGWRMYLVGAIGLGCVAVAAILFLAVKIATP